MDDREVIARTAGIPHYKADAVLAALKASGRVIVPVEPTEAMCEAGYDADTEGGHFDGPAVYHAMIAAAKEPTDGR